MPGIGLFTAGLQSFVGLGVPGMWPAAFCIRNGPIRWEKSQKAAPLLARPQSLSPPSFDFLR